MPSVAVMLKVQNRNDLGRIVLHQWRFSSENTVEVYLQYDLEVLWEHSTEKRLSKARKSQDNLKTVLNLSRPLRTNYWKRKDTRHCCHDHWRADSNEIPPQVQYINSRLVTYCFRQQKSTSFCSLHHRLIPLVHRSLCGHWLTII